LTSGQRPAAVIAGMAALVDAELYRRDRQIVYVARVPARAADGRALQIPGIARVETPHLQHQLGRAAVWMRYDGRRRGWAQVDVPVEIATTIAALPNEWPFSAITGVIATPTMRPDGTMLTEAGYDAATGYYLFDPPAMPTMPAMPTRADAMTALRLLLGLLSEFPFADDASRAVALSLILSLVLRPALAPTVPLHVVSAPEAGSGKSFLFDLASLIAIGEVAPAIGRGLAPEETEKRLVGAALDGRVLILVDNVNGELRSEFLCQAVERPLIKPRPLGTSVMPTIANSFVCGANGINIEIADDLVRRTIQCTLDANVEEPYLRQFRRDPVREILADRGRYVAAALTIVRAYVVAGMPGRPTPLASFGAWSDKVRGALIWLGQADPVDTIARLAVADPTRERRGEVFAAIAAAFPNGDFSVRELVQASEGRETLRAALVGVAGGKDGGIGNERVGWWLRRNAGRIAGGRKLLRSDEAVEGRAGRWVMAVVRRAAV
jgi:putative DNA primase/helicase